MKRSLQTSQKISPKQNSWKKNRLHAQVLFSHTQYTNTFNLDSIIKPRIIVHVSLFLNISIFLSESCFLSLGLCVTVSAGACVVGNLSRLRLPLPTGNARRAPGSRIQCTWDLEFFALQPRSDFRRAYAQEHSIFFLQIIKSQLFESPIYWGYLAGIFLWEVCCIYSLSVSQLSSAEIARLELTLPKLTPFYLLHSTFSAKKIKKLSCPGGDRDARWRSQTATAKAEPLPPRAILN